MSDEDERRWLDDQREQMGRHLARAVEQFGVVICGQPVEGLRARSISVGVKRDGDDQPYWLRVGREWVRWIEDVDTADFWTGIPDSNAVVGVRKPHVLRSVEWDDQDGVRRVRADLMTTVTGRPCSETDALRIPPDLPETWWAELRRSVDVIRSTPSTRYANLPARPGRRVREVFGDDVADAFRPTVWETAHGDLHWSNVLGSELGILDWELWGPGPAGLDAATLYLFALLVPDVAKRVHQTFADVLDSDAGQVAQVSVASRILFRAGEDQNSDLAEVVRAHISSIIGTSLTSTPM